MSSFINDFKSSIDVKGKDDEDFEESEKDRVHAKYIFQL
jgi:hypothetical protein